jgi:predicted ATPase with chaperone activity
MQGPMCRAPDTLAARLLALSRTLADLEGGGLIQMPQMAEALQLRRPAGSVSYLPTSESM